MLDTNTLLSALIVKDGTTDAIVQACWSKAFTLLTCEEQFAELRDCFAGPWLVPERIRRHEAGLLSLRSHRGKRIVTAGHFARRLSSNEAMQRSTDTPLRPPRRRH